MEKTAVVNNELVKQSAGTRKEKTDLAKIAVIGSGVVGQATGKGFIEKGHEVVFCDIDPSVLTKLKGEGHNACMPDLLEEENTDAFFLTVSTPTIDGEIELKFLKSAIANLGSHLKKKEGYQLIVVRSTVPPGTTENIVIPLLEEYSEKKAGKDFGVCMNPEYLREEKAVEDFQKPWIIVIGSLDDESGKTLEKIYEFYECPIKHVSLKEAEIQKYIHNLFNASKISFFNEMRMICEKIKVDTDKVFELVSKSAEGSWNQEYGIRDFGPFSGSCLPKDTSAFLSWSKEELKNPMHQLKATIKVNEITKERYNNNSS